MLLVDFGGVISRTLFETHDETERVLGLKRGTLAWRGPLGLVSDAGDPGRASLRLPYYDYRSEC